MSMGLAHAQLMLYYRVTPIALLFQGVHGGGGDSAAAFPGFHRATKGACPQDTPSSFSRESHILGP